MRRLGEAGPRPEQRQRLGIRCAQSTGRGRRPKGRSLHRGCVSWRRKLEAFPGAPRPRGGRLRETPVTRTGSCLVSEAQLRALGLRPEAFTHPPLGPAGPQAAPTRQVGVRGRQPSGQSAAGSIVRRSQRWTLPPLCASPAGGRRVACAGCPEAAAEHAWQTQKEETCMDLQGVPGARSLLDSRAPPAADRATA